MAWDSDPEVVGNSTYVALAGLPLSFAAVLLVTRVILLIERRLAEKRTIVAGPPDA